MMDIYANGKEIDMNKEFEVHMLNEDGKIRAKAIAEAFDHCLTSLMVVCPVNNREFSIVRTKLEEACFFAKKSMANDHRNCQ